MRPQVLTLLQRGPSPWLRQVRIPAIVGSDSADRGHPRKAYILVTAILSPGGHDASTLGVSRPSLRRRSESPFSSSR